MRQRRIPATLSLCGPTRGSALLAVGIFSRSIWRHDVAPTFCHGTLPTYAKCSVKHSTTILVFMDAIVILPDYLQCLWRLPPDDDDCPSRWRLIKVRFSHRLAAGEYIPQSRRRKGERSIWQWRYWEHVIRDEQDFLHHLDYIHYNPVKHG